MITTSCRWMSIAALALMLVAPIWAQTEAVPVPGVKVAAPAAADRQAIPPEMLKLLPPNLVAFVQGTSVRSIEEAARAVVGSVDPRMAKQVSLAPMIGPMAEMGIDIDPNKVIGFAVALPESAEEAPIMCFLLPVGDLDKTKASLSQNGAMEAVRFEGSYVAMSSAGPYTPADAPAFLVRGVPLGHVGAVADAARAITHYRGMIDSSLGELEGLKELFAGAGPEAEIIVEMFDGALQCLRTLVDEVGVLEAGVGATGEAVDYRMAMLPRAGKTISMAKYFPGTDGAKIASIIGSGYPMSFIAGLDMQALAKWYMKLVKTLPMSEMGISAEALDKIMKAAQTMMSKLGSGMGYGMTLTSGIQGVLAMEATDPEGVMNECMKMLNDPEWEKMGMKVAGPAAQVEVAGTKVTRFEIGMDMKKLMAATGQEVPEGAEDQLQKVMKIMFGGDTMVMTMAPVGKYVVGTFGRNEAELTRVIAAAKSQAVVTDPYLKNAVAAANGKPALLMHFELRSLLVGAVTLAKELGAPDAPAVNPKGPAAPANFWMAPHQGGLAFGIFAEVGGIGKLIKEMTR